MRKKNLGSTLYAIYWYFHIYHFVFVTEVRIFTGFVLLNHWAIKKPSCKLPFILAGPFHASKCGLATDCECNALLQSWRRLLPQGMHHSSTLNSKTSEKHMTSISWWLSWLILCQSYKICYSSYTANPFLTLFYFSSAVPETPWTELHQEKDCLTLRVDLAKRMPQCSQSKTFCFLVHVSQKNIETPKNFNQVVLSVLLLIICTWGIRLTY